MNKLGQMQWKGDAQDQKRDGSLRGGRGWGWNPGSVTEPSERVSFLEWVNRSL